ncbi:MAG: hypothetical protein IJV33_11575 [Bacteroidaceae bacterium]|nr:hypothetical protein [Bacteroidaceae bacterium]
MIHPNITSLSPQTVSNHAALDEHSPAVNIVLSQNSHARSPESGLSQTAEVV